MHEDALPPEQRDALRALRPAADRGFHLAGGTGLCLHLGHRRSIDLDLFRTAPFDPDDLLRDLRAAGVLLERVRTAPETVHAEILGVRASLLVFPYETLEPPVPAADGVPVASLADIAAMKIEAIASRGARKDFFDLYFLCTSSMTLADALAAFEKRFAAARPDRYHRLRALTFFEDAEKEPEPVLLRPVEWRTVRELFEREVRALWREGEP